MRSLIAMAALALALAGCGAEDQRLWRSAAPIIGALVAPTPAPKPERQRKPRRPVTKD